MKYCTKCVLPDSRPGLVIDESGVCSACLGHADKNSEINWLERKSEFGQIVSDAKKLKRPFDCVVPVSGGKDSTYRVVKCIEYGLHVLAVTWRAPGRTPIGQENLDNLISLGVDHIDYSINPDVERQFAYEALEKTGSVSVPMHFGLYMIPLRIALAMNVPLVIWGESPAMESGGSKEERKSDRLEHDFLKTHGILQSTLIEDWIGEYLSAEDLEMYKLPPEEDFKRVGLRSIFIGSYFSWSPQESLRLAAEHGFKARKEGPKVGYYNYADIDCNIISVHHFFKWLKFGFTRLFDDLSLEIRNGRMKRDEAIAIIKEKGEQTPDEDIAWLCDFVRIDEEDFWSIAEKYRNHDIWCQENGTWKIKDFLIEDWDW